LGLLIVLNNPDQFENCISLIRNIFSLQIIFAIQVALRICHGNRSFGSPDGVKSIATSVHLFFTRSRLSSCIKHTVSGFRLMLVLAVFFAISIRASFALTAGDYKSVDSGKWDVLATWARYNGSAWIPSPAEGWPGQFTGTTGAVLIKAGDNVTAAGIISTNPLGTVTIEGTLTLGDNASFTLSTASLTITAGLSTNAIIYFDKKGELKLPYNAAIYLTAGSLTGINCNANQIISFGLVSFSCTGGGSCGDFGTLMTNGGNQSATLNSGVGSNIQINCIGTPITPIVYMLSSGATGATTAPLPSGVTGNYNLGSGLYTISGIPTVAGTFNYLLTQTGPGVCLNATNSGTITVLANLPPVLITPPSKSFCVESLSLVYYDPTKTNILNPGPPDYYTFLAGDTDFDLNPSSYFLDDKTPIGDLILHWKITDSANQPINAVSGVLLNDIVGQVSDYTNAIATKTNIVFQGAVNADVTYKITYWLEDTCGNLSDPKVITITIKPRPNINKVN